MRSITLLLICCFLIVLVSLSSGAQYVVEVLVVLEKDTRDKWVAVAGSEQRVKIEIEGIFIETNRLYSSLQKYGVDIEIRLKQPILLLNENITPQNAFLEGKIVDVDLVSKAFHEWLEKNQQLEYDHATFLTANDIARGGIAITVGVATLGEVCKRTGTSVVESSMTYEDARRLAHEIGHSLGSWHDGQNNSCSPNDLFVMSPALMTISKNKWFFSSCSADSIRKFVTGPKSECLQQTRSHPLRNFRLADFITPDDVCKRAVGSFFERGSYEQYGDEMCMYLKCHITLSDGRRAWTPGESPDGIPCGHQKKCVHGKCVSSPGNDQNRSDTCPWGDAPEVSDIDHPIKSCSDLRTNPKLCKHFVKQACCATCAQLGV